MLWVRDLAKPINELGQPACHTTTGIIVHLTWEWTNRDVWVIPARSIAKDGEVSEYTDGSTHSEIYDHDHIRQMSMCECSLLIISIIRPTQGLSHSLRCVNISPREQQKAFLVCWWWRRTENSDVRAFGSSTMYTFCCGWDRLEHSHLYFVLALDHSGCAWVYDESKMQMQHSHSPNLFRYVVQRFASFSFSGLLPT